MLGISLAEYIEDAVMLSEIERLADLSGYLKVPSRPQWHRAKVRWRDMLQHTAAFMA